jgi:hypothetical protein
MAIAVLCDSCGDLYPEGQEGSMSGMGTMMRIVDGRQQNQQARMDTCASCVDARASLGSDRRSEVRRSILGRREKKSDD